MTPSSRSSRLTAALAAGLLAACAAPETQPSLRGDLPEAAVLVGLVSPSSPARVGDTIAVRADIEGPAPLSVEAVQARMRFDPSRLRYLGQGDTPHLLMLNEREAEQGRLRWLVLEPHGLPDRPVDLRFEVRHEDYTTGLALQLEEVVASGGAVVRRPLLREGVRQDGAPPVGKPVHLDVAHWVARLDARYLGARTARMNLAGDGLIYGDATLNGVITGGDVGVVANAAVGNLPLLSLVNRDFAIAGNVAPMNLPGLGEFDDPTPPGRGPDGSFTLTAADASLIANEAVGLDEPVVGAAIPGRALATNRGVISDSITASRVLSRDTIYELQGTVFVGPRPCTVASCDTATVTLTIQAGTRLEGDPITRGQLVISRGANLVAVGTRLQPIVFACKGSTPSPCWGGLTINGFGVLNNGNTGGGGGVGFPNREGPGTGLYGGNLPEDSSGVLRFVRIENAGAGNPGSSGSLPSLRLLGVGGRTVIDTLQVLNAGDDGVLVSGGTARVRGLVITSSARDGLVWDDGWQGGAQFLVVQQGSNGRYAVRGSNFAGNPNAGPRSAPVLSHVTIVGPSTAATGSRALLFENGSAGAVTNAVVLRAAEAGFDVQGAASCARLTDSLSVSTSIFFNDPAANGADDVDCADEPGELAAAARQNRFEDPLLGDPFTTIAPDWRPLGGGPAATGGATPPALSLPPAFFEAITHVGAVTPWNAFGSNVPWYAGWTRGF